MPPCFLPSFPWCTFKAYKLSSWTTKEEGGEKINVIEHCVATEIARVDTILYCKITRIIIILHLDEPAGTKQKLYKFQPLEC